MHMKKTSPWRRVVEEALTHRGFIEWTAVAHLMVSYINADGLKVEVRGGHTVRVVWKNGAEREYTFKTPTKIDCILDEVLAEKS